MIIHFTVKACYLPIALTTHQVAAWLWERLRRAFPNALAALFMPNHPHIMTSTDDAGASRNTFMNVMAGLRRSFNPGAGIVWEPIGPAHPIVDAQKARRLVRYIALNPCRAGLTDDPLSWPWSTHRDVMSAIADPWVDANDLRRVLGWRGGSFADELHRYVSSAPSVNVAGTPPPRAAVPTVVAAKPIVALIQAAAAATRGRPEDIERQTSTRALFLRLAMRLTILALKAGEYGFTTSCSFLATRDANSRRGDNYPGTGGREQTSRSPRPSGPRCRRALPR